MASEGTAAEAAREDRVVMVMATVQVRGRGPVRGPVQVPGRVPVRVRVRVREVYRYCARTSHCR